MNAKMLLHKEVVVELETTRRSVHLHIGQPLSYLNDPPLISVYQCSSVVQFS